MRSGCRSAGGGRNAGAEVPGSAAGRLRCPGQLQSCFGSGGGRSARRGRFCTHGLCEGRPSQTVPVAECGLRGVGRIIKTGDRSPGIDDAFRGEGGAVARGPDCRGAYSGLPGRVGRCFAGRTQGFCRRLPSGDGTKKSGPRAGTGLRKFALGDYFTFGPAATRLLPSSLPVNFVKFFTKRLARSSAFVSHSLASL